MAGAAIGAAAATSASAANANAQASYNAGYGAGATQAYNMGALYATLPSSCAPTIVGGTYYQKCGGTWFLPTYSANDLYYRVVPAP